MKEDKVIIPFNELEGYRINENLKENKLSKLINKRTSQETLKTNGSELIVQNEKFKELLYTIYQPKNMVAFKGILWSDKLVQQLFLSSDYLTAAVGSDENALEIKILEANRPEDYGLYYLQRGGIAEIIGTNLLLSKDGLFTLLSLSDNKRYKNALSFLMHKVENDEVTVKELQNISQESIAFKDPRWFGGFFVGEISEFQDYHIEKGLKELEKIGLLKVDKEKIEVKEEGEVLLSLLERRQVLLAYDNYYLQSKDKVNGERIFFIKTDSALFLIQEAESIYTFTSIDMDIAKEVLETIFQVVDIIAEPESMLSEEEIQSVTFADDKVDYNIIEIKDVKGDISQNEQGKNIEKTKGVICPSCEVKAHGNSKFCKKCGAELKKQPSIEPKKKYCYQCGNEVSGTGKFCRKCGANVLNEDE